MCLNQVTCIGEILLCDGMYPLWNDHRAGRCYLSLSIVAIGYLGRSNVTALKKKPSHKYYYALLSTSYVSLQKKLPRCSTWENLVSTSYLVIILDSHKEGKIHKKLYWSNFSSKTMHLTSSKHWHLTPDKTLIRTMITTFWTFLVTAISLYAYLYIKNGWLTTDPTEQTLLAGDGVGDMGDGVPVDRFQLGWCGEGADGALGCELDFTLWKTVVKNTYMKFLMTK